MPVNVHNRTDSIYFIECVSAVRSNYTRASVLSYSVTYIILSLVNKRTVLYHPYSVEHDVGGASLESGRVVCDLCGLRLWSGYVFEVLCGVQEETATHL